MTTKAGRPRDPAADRAITAATVRLLQDHGYRGLSIEAVAEAAGVAKTTIYRRYASKRELVVGALRDETEFPPPPPELPFKDALAWLVRQGVSMLIGARAIRILASFLSEEEREPALLEIFRARLLEPRRAMLVEILRAGIDRGEVAADTDVELVTEMVFGALLSHHIRGLVADEAWIERETAAVAAMLTPPGGAHR